MFVLKASRRDIYVRTTAMSILVFLQHDKPDRLCTSKYITNLKNDLISVGSNWILYSYKLELRYYLYKFLISELDIESSSRKSFPENEILLFAFIGIPLIRINSGGLIARSIDRVVKKKR